MQRLSELTRTGRGGGGTRAWMGCTTSQTVKCDRCPLSTAARVLVVAGIADPDSFAAQLRRAGAGSSCGDSLTITPIDSSDITQLAHDAVRSITSLCTLKDAVKLGPRWPREGPPLWYVSLRCEIEVGGADVSALLDRVLAARPAPDKQALNDWRLNDSLHS